MANPPSKPPRGIKTPKETVSTYIYFKYNLFLICIYFNMQIRHIRHISYLLI